MGYRTRALVSGREIYMCKRSAYADQEFGSSPCANKQPSERNCRTATYSLDVLACVEAAFLSLYHPLPVEKKQPYLAFLFR